MRYTSTDEVLGFYGSSGNKVFLDELHYGKNGFKWSLNEASFVRG